MSRLLFSSFLFTADIPRKAAAAVEEPGPNGQQSTTKRNFSIIWPRKFVFRSPVDARKRRGAGGKGEVPGSGDNAVKPWNRRINPPYRETFQPNHHLGGITGTPLPRRNFCRGGEEARV